MPVSRHAVPSEGGGHCGAPRSRRAFCANGGVGRLETSLTPCLNGDVFLGDTTGTRIRSIQLSRYVAPAPVMEFRASAAAVSAAPLREVVHRARRLRSAGVHELVRFRADGFEMSTPVVGHMSAPRV